MITLSPSGMVTHLKSHKAHQDTIPAFDEDKYKKAVAECDIFAELPQPPAKPIEPIYGLPLSSAFVCNICSTYITEAKNMVFHIRHSHKDHSLSDYIPCTVQKMNNSTRNKLFPVIVPAPLPPPDDDTIFGEASRFLNTKPALFPQATDNRNISSFNYLSKFYRETNKYAYEELRSFVIMPTEEEFPGLNDAVVVFIHACEDLINDSPDLVCRMLNSENRLKCVYI